MATPSFLSNNLSKSKCGSDNSSLSINEDDDNSIIFLYPISFKANKGSNPVVPEYLKFICVPIIGCVPTLDIFSANSNAPHRLVLSHNASDFILLSFGIYQSDENSLFKFGVGHNF